MLDKVKRALGAKTPVKDTKEGATGDSNNLLAWWQTEFTPEEQNYILAKYQPLVIGGAVEGEGSDANDIILADGSLGSVGTLAALSTWFTSGDDIRLARRILAKSVDRQESETGSAIDRHYIYYHMIRVYYRDRDENALALAIQACEKQIALAPQAICDGSKEWGDVLPAHPGFQQLAIILERNKDYEGAIRLSEEALQQGWSGDWEKRISRCKQRSSR